MKVLLTGGNGFMGSWVVKRLLERGISVRVFATRTDRSPLRAIMGSRAEEPEWFVGDVGRIADVERASEGCEAIIHIAALLGPACAADPVRCMAVNLGGTLNVFEVAKRLRIERVIYTSSAAVFGPTDGKHPYPRSHYAAFKLAEEGCARSYELTDRLPSIGFRPFVVYGPGRERGMSAGPSFACRAAARGEPFTVPFTGRTNFVYVDDVASAYEQALLSKPTKAAVYNLAGDVASVEDFIGQIRKRVPSARIDCSGEPLPITPDLTPDERDLFLPGIQRTPLEDGIAKTIEFYSQLRQ
jgi:UDP-glucose 4-epimerase